MSASASASRRASAEVWAGGEASQVVVEAVEAVEASLTVLRESVNRLTSPRIKS